MFGDVLDITTKDIIVHELPLVDFIIENHCENEGNIFTDLSSVINSEISSIQYDFNDGNISNVSNEAALCWIV